MKVIMLIIGVLILGNCSKPQFTENQIQARENFINGESAECMMDQFFMYGQNWQKLQGENGQNGIDGLYIQYNKHNISKVLIAESKWNTSRLGMIRNNSVKQMSKAWILTKLKAAKVHNLHIRNFDQIAYLVEYDMYIGRLFKLKPMKGDRLKIQLFDIKNSTDEKDIEKIKMSEIIIDKHAPQNAFQKAMLDTYNDCRSSATEKWLPDLDIDNTK